MTRFILTTATAALVAGASALPALSAAESDLNSMTCADFRALDEAKQVEVAYMAIAEQNGGGESLRDTSKATTATGGETTEAEADNMVSGGTQVDNNGTATATDGSDSMDRETVAEADMEALYAACDRNLDATVLEAASGMDTQR